MRIIYQPMQKYILTSILLTICCWNASPTPQQYDELLYNGETLLVYLSLPEYFFNSEGLAIDLFEGREPCVMTSCWNGYYKEWEIIDNQLYLTGICSCCYYEDGIKANLETLFKGKVKNGKVKADWVTSTRLAKAGKRIYAVSDYNTIYEKEFEFEFVDGQVISVSKYDNSKSRVSNYGAFGNELPEFIYQNINWDILPPLSQPVKVNLRFSGNEEGKIGDIEIVGNKNHDKIFYEEAIRVMKKISGWAVLYSKEELVRIPYSIKIVFSEENKQKYNSK